ncbi:hypothetical protein ES703_32172 [subsurface metagenome]
MSDHILHLSDEQEKALVAVCAEIFDKTGNKVRKEDVIDMQVSYYIKRMLQSAVKIPLPDQVLIGLTDEGQAELMAKVINFYPGFVDEMRKPEEPDPGMWARIKNFILRV